MVQLEDINLSEVGEEPQDLEKMAQRQLPFQLSVEQINKLNLVDIVEHHGEEQNNINEDEQAEKEVVP